MSKLFLRVEAYKEKCKAREIEIVCSVRVWGPRKPMLANGHSRAERFFQPLFKIKKIFWPENEIILY